MTAKHWIAGNAGLAVAALLAASCGDGLGQLTPEETEALALKVGAVSSMDWFGRLGDVSGEYEFVIPCPRSGNVTFSGTSKLETDGGWVISFDVDGTQKYNGCAEVVGSGETMTLHGTVNGGLSFTEHPLYDTQIIEIKGTWRGTVAWSSSKGDSGECDADLALDATYMWSAWSQEVSLFGGLDGTFCTIAVDAPFEEWYEETQ